MKRCLELASNGLLSARPNPSVGAVLVHNETIIGEGYTSPYGGSHGEVNCINSVSKQNRIKIPDSTLYVSLEPCSHFGKTPPCSNLIVEHKISEVVIGCVDTFSEVAGKGIKKLQDNGIKTTVGVLEKECRALNKRFFVFHEKKRPFVILKWAKTKDDFIAPVSDLHESQRWITGPMSNQMVHKLRGEEMAILVGSNTVKIDNPSLTTRKFPGKNPIRVILDRNLEIWNEKEQYLVFNEEATTIIMNAVKEFKENNVIGVKLDFEDDIVSQLLTHLHQSSIDSLIVEGGTKTLQSFIDKDYWDEAMVFKGNKVFGEGIEAPTFISAPYERIELGEDELFLFKNGLV